MRSKYKIIKYKSIANMPFNVIVTSASVIKKHVRYDYECLLAVSRNIYKNEKKTARETSLTIHTHRKCTKAHYYSNFYSIINSLHP